MKEQNKKKWISTPMTKIYSVKLVIRIGVFLTVFVLYLQDKDSMMQCMVLPVWNGVSLLHVLWFCFMGMMILHIFPMKKVSMALRKLEKEPFQEVEGYSELELHQFVQRQNMRARRVMLVWMLFNGVFGLLYLFDVLKDVDLLMLTVTYFLCDYICILFYCPFQHLLMKNPCCVNCRIYDWGHFMMFTPMLFIRNFFSWSLFFTSCVVLIRWEVVYAKHPERFWRGSNRTLQCANCNDKTCQMKNRIMGKSI